MNFNFLLLLRFIQAAFCQSETMDKQRKYYLSEEVLEVGITQSITLDTDEPLFWEKSKYQEVAVYKSKHFGKVLVIDDAVQLSEKDADSYNEMMAHVPLMEHSNPRNVLIIGGGDGFILNEVGCFDFFHFMINNRI